MGGKMKNLFLISTLFVSLFFSVSCSGNDSSVSSDCENGTLQCHINYLNVEYSGVCRHKIDFISYNLFEKCKEGCNWSTGKCNPWTDPDTNLTWSTLIPSDGVGGHDYDCTGGAIDCFKTLTWDQAVEYCDNLEEAGYSDWHLPTISELRTLVFECSKTLSGGECGVTDKCLSTDCFISNDCYCYSGSSVLYYSKLGDWESFWTSSTVSDNSDSAWLLNFNNGSITPIEKFIFARVRCVR